MEDSIFTLPAETAKTPDAILNTVFNRWAVPGSISDRPPEQMAGAVPSGEGGVLANSRKLELLLCKLQRV
jgi:hypothetical protein